MSDSSKKKPTPPAEDPGTPEAGQAGLVGAFWQFVSTMLPGGPPSAGRHDGHSNKGGQRRAALTPQQAQAMLSQLFKLTVEVANGMWRIRRRIQTDSAAADRGLTRHVDSTWSAFENHGLEIKDHTGEKYVAGMAMSVVAYQATAGITFEKVLETVRPSIYFQDQLIQRGEVIVATPETMPEMDEPAALQPTDSEPPQSVVESVARPIAVEKPSDAGTEENVANDAAPTDDKTDEPKS